MSYFRFADCPSGKIPHARDEAMRHMVDLLTGESDPQNAQGLNVYRCRACHRWHVGHSATHKGFRAWVAPEKRTC